MTILLTLINESAYFDFPQSLWGRSVFGFGWLLLFCLIAVLLGRWRKYNRRLDRRSWGILIALVISVPLTSLFVGVRLQAGGTLPLPGIPIDPEGPALMIFAVLPWVLAGGFFGPFVAAVLAGFSGLILSLWDTHNLFMPLQMALLATLFSVGINQRYRTRLYRILCHPIVAAILLVLVYPLIYSMATIFMPDGTLAVRLDYVLTNVMVNSLAVGSELLIAGLFAEVIAVALPNVWGGKGSLVPSPPEKSLEARVQYGTTPLALVLVITMVAGAWSVAGNASRQNLRERMADTAQIAADSVPFFLETGQNQIIQLASNISLYMDDGEQLKDVLAEDVRRVPFFKQLFLFDNSGNPLTGYPYEHYYATHPPGEEQLGIQLALTGIPFQTYTIPPKEGDTAADISFIAAITDQTKNIQGVLIGRAGLTSNPFTQPIISSLSSLAGVDGEGLLVDENGVILFHSNPNLVMTSYMGEIASESLFYEEAAPDGTRRLVFYQPAEGRPWSVVFTIPTRRAQQLALNIAVPLLGMIMFLSVVAVIFIRFGLRAINKSLRNLAAQAGNISKGQLDSPLPLEGEDEIGQLRRAFEQMRISLKAHLDELNRLLNVSQGVASNLEMEDAVKSVLESAVGMGASGSRIVLAPRVLPELGKESLTPVTFSRGSAGKKYQSMDKRVMELTSQQDLVVLTNVPRLRHYKFSEETPCPEAFVAVALRHENTYYGTFWVAFDQPHQFSDGEIRFLVTLAGQAALAAANAHLYRNAEIERQRLTGILESTPEPVLVTDQQDELMLANPAAWRLFGVGEDKEAGLKSDDVISQEKLISILHSLPEGQVATEFPLPNKRTYSVTVSSVLVEGNHVGRVYVMRDVTHFKELDSLKSEFVANVSHDLRSPLSLIRGYAGMLEMVGHLNEQQEDYVQKIVTRVTNMSQIVNNLLDLGRIEAGVGLRVEDVDIGEVIDQVQDALVLKATQKQVEIKVDIEDGADSVIEADPALLRQALQNLVDNAIKYSKSNGEVRVAVSSPEDDAGAILFAVNDNGMGIAPVDQNSIFDRFYRVSGDGSDQSPGTGLGLTIVKSIAEHHKGKVWVESQLGKGSTFFFEIPSKQQQL